MLNMIPYTVEDEVLEGEVLEADVTRAGDMESQIADAFKANDAEGYAFTLGETNGLAGGSMIKLATLILAKGKDLPRSWCETAYAKYRDGVKAGESFGQYVEPTDRQIKQQLDKLYVAHDFVSRSGIELSPARVTQMINVSIATRGQKESTYARLVSLLRKFKDARNMSDASVMDDQEAFYAHVDDVAPAKESSKKAPKTALDHLDRALGILMEHVSPTYAKDAGYATAIHELVEIMKRDVGKNAKA